MKYKRIWHFGNEQKDDSINDFVSKYISETGIIIECKFCFGSNKTWYKVKNQSFGTLKEAKKYVESL